MIRLLVALLLTLPLSVRAQDRAGEVDYYVMALSWSPNWCAREGDGRGAPECAAGAGLGWTLHGLWPQYETGWPDYCETDARDPSRKQSDRMADIMGSGGLAWYQWKKHGRCTGLSGPDYYALSRAAYESVTRPALLRELGREVKIAASVIEAAFLEVNPQLGADMLTVTCKGGAIAEARICLTRDLQPRDCGPDVRRECTLDDAVLSPLR